MMNQSMPKHMHKGHIPGSRNLHKDLLLDPDTKCFLDKDQLLKGRMKVILYYSIIVFKY